MNKLQKIYSTPLKNLLINTFEKKAKKSGEIPFRVLPHSLNCVVMIS